MKRAIQITTLINILLTTFIIIQALLWVQSFDFEAFREAHAIIAVFMLLGAYLIRVSVYVISALAGILGIFLLIALVQSFQPNRHPLVVYLVNFVVLILFLGVEIRIALVFLFEESGQALAYFPIVLLVMGMTLLMMIPSILTFIQWGTRNKHPLPTQSSN